MDDKTIAYAVGIIGALGALLKVIYDATASQKKQDNEASSTRIAALEARVEGLHKDHADCLQRAVEAATELRLLKMRITEVENDRDRLRAEVERLQELIASRG